MGRTGKAVQEHDRRRILRSRLAVEELPSSYISVMISCHNASSLFVSFNDPHGIAECVGTPQLRMLRYQSPNVDSMPLFFAKPLETAAHPLRLARHAERFRSL